MRAREITDALVGAAQAIPETEIKPIISPIQIVVSLVMARGNHPAA
jgi:hypothetical protein